MKEITVFLISPGRGTEKLKKLSVSLLACLQHDVLLPESKPAASTLIGQLKWTWMLATQIISCNSFLHVGLCVSTSSQSSALKVHQCYDELLIRFSVESWWEGIEWQTGGGGWWWFIVHVKKTIQVSACDVQMLILHHPECANFTKCSSELQTHARTHNHTITHTQRH